MFSTENNGEFRRSVERDSTEYLYTSQDTPKTSHKPTTYPPIRPDPEDPGYESSEVIYMALLFVVFVVLVIACLLFARKDSPVNEGDSTLLESEDVAGATFIPGSNPERNNH